MKAHPTLNNQYQIRSDANQEETEKFARRIPFRETNPPGISYANGLFTTAM